VIANVIDKSNGKINSKGDLKKLYDLGLDQDEYNTFSGPISLPAKTVNLSCWTGRNV
jgi:hypothetical protein